MTRFLHFFFLALVCTACGTEDRFDVDLSGTEPVEFDIRRMDREVFEVNTDTADMAAHHLELMEKYGDFYRLYYRRMLAEGSPNGPMAHMRLKGFIEDINMQEVYEGIKEVHEDLSKEEERFEKAFRHYRYHFPDSTVPRDLIAYQGGFSYAVYPTDSLIGIGLEWFLGAEHEVTARLPKSQFPRYKKAGMEPKYMVSEVVKGWLKFKRRERAAEAASVLEHMIFHGKMLYGLDALMPGTPDSIKIKYSDEQMRWVRSNEGRIWKTLVDREVFFEKDQKMVSKLVEPAPFTSILPRESPGRVGQWLGWQMDRAFMEEHPQMPLERLFKIEDAQRIFEAYKPERTF
jgi:hypothetical protein